MSKGLSEAQMDCLRTVAEAGPLTDKSPELTRFCQEIKGSDYDVLGECLRDGLLEWDRPRRSRNVALTPAGRAALASRLKED